MSSVTTAALLRQMPTLLVPHFSRPLVLQANLKFNHAAGDLKYGVISEFVDVPGTFFARGFDLMTALVFTNGLQSDYTDHWDSWQLAPQDVTGSGDPVTTADPFSPTGPKNSVSVAAQLAPVHANGVPRFSAPVLHQYLRQIRRPPTSSPM